VTLSKCLIWLKKYPGRPGVSRKWGDEDASDMTGWAIVGREIADGVDFAVGRNGD